MSDRLFFSICLPVAVLTATGCGGPELVNTATLPNTYQCQHMKEICKEARDFESSYSRLSPEEKKDAENVLKAYRMQCNDALDLCNKSADKK
jgi:hypothetical protein